MTDTTIESISDIPTAAMTVEDSAPLAPSLPSASAIEAPPSIDLSYVLSSIQDSLSNISSSLLPSTGTEVVKEEVRDSFRPIRS